MDSSSRGFFRKFLSGRVRSTIAAVVIFIWPGAGFLICVPAVQAQTAQPAPSSGAATATPDQLGATAPTAGVASSQQPASSISGSVADPNGGPVDEAQITLARNGQSLFRAWTADNGQFSFPEIAPGTYQLTIAAEGFQEQSVSVVVSPGETHTVPRIVLALAPLVTSINVTPSQGEVAQYQLQEEEKQLVLGFVPNYYVTYYPHTAPLTPRQKFQLTWKAVFNPFSLGLTAAFAGGEQATGMYSGYGQGAQGYARRFGAAYATLSIGTFIGDALLPSVLKQDPRYYYKGTGSVRSRILYAISRSVICKGDNGHWEPDYSAFLGHLAAGGISNLYLPSQNRNGWAVTLENGLIGIGFGAATNLLQEFLVPRLTPSLAHRQFSSP
ncbi:MAG: carboxypeptidase regulatory-like domain-containing protein [Acidobacteria bacterium]|nr:MAG: carboxypeptidase regulatory-like domain-containing protein [Acidobacteriota bacterium]